MEVSKLESIIKEALSKESFSDNLIRLIREKERNNVEVYKAAGISRKLYSKIVSSRHYHPNKNTVTAFAVALRLNEKEAEDFLKHAGYCFCESEPFDAAIKYFINIGEYDRLVIDRLMEKAGLGLLPQNWEL